MKVNNTSRSALIRRLLADGKTPTQIAEQLKCQRAAVHAVVFYDRKKAEKAKPAAKRGPGRPKGTKNKATAQLELDNYALRSRLDEAESKRRHAEITLSGEVDRLGREVLRYRGMGFIERLGFLFRGV